jgi:hypothetical protein
MSLKINQEIVTRDGFSVPSGTIVTFNTIFPQSSCEAHINMFFYKNQEVLNAGSLSYYPSEMNNLNYEKTYNFSEFTGLTPMQIHVDLREYLLTIYTGGTIDIVL